MRALIVDRALTWLVLGGLVCMLPLAHSYSLTQLGLIRALWGKPMEARGALAANERENPLAYAGAVRTRRTLAKNTRAGSATKSSLARTWQWAQKAGQQFEPNDRVFMNTAHFPAYVYGNFFAYPVPFYMESNGSSIVDYDTMKSRGRYVAANELGTLRAAGFTHVLIESGPGRVRLLELGGGKPR